MAASKHFVQHSTGSCQKVASPDRLAGFDFNGLQVALVLQNRKLVRASRDIGLAGIDPRISGHIAADHRIDNRIVGPIGKGRVRENDVQENCCRVQRFS
jgi:hypothetical protein